MSQISKKFLASNAVDQSKLRLDNNSFLRARNAADSGDVNTFKVNASDKIEFASVPQVTSDPSATNDLVRKSYVDAIAQGIKPKAAVRVASTANVVIASALENGDTLDGVTLATGDRVLLKDQSDPEDNGIYIVAASGAASRSTDFDSLSPIDEINGAYTFAQEGTANAGKAFVQTGVVATLGTDPINFVFFNSAGSLVGFDMITISGFNVSVDLATASGLESTNPGNSAGQLRVKLEASNPSLKFTGSNELAAKLDASGAIDSGASGLAVQVDNSTIEINTNALRVKDAGITSAKLATAVAGDMIAGGAGTALSVDLHTTSGLESSNAGNAAGQLRIKLEASDPSLQIDGSNQLGAKLDAAGAIASGASGLAVQVASGIEISSNALRISSAAAGTGLDWSAGVLSQAADYSTTVNSNPGVFAATEGVRGKDSGGTSRFAVGYGNASAIAEGTDALFVINELLGKTTIVGSNNNLDNSSTATGALRIRSGAVYDVGAGAGSANTGNITVSSGSTEGSGASGQARFQTGATTSGTSGQLFLQSGNSSGGDSGNIAISTGTATGTRGSASITANGITLDSLTGDISASSNKIVSLSDPSSAQDAATKAYVDGLTYLTAGAGLSYSPAGTLIVTAADTSITVGADDIAVNLASASGLEISSGLKVKLEASNPSLQISSGELGAKLGAGIEKGSAGIYVDSYRHAAITLGAGDITAQYYDLAVKLIPESAEMSVEGSMEQRYGIDYDFDNTGGVTRLRFDSTNLPSSDLATGGAAALVSGDILYVKGIKV